MAAGEGSALEWALALVRAPAQRHALRQRPLPDGIGTLLVIAAETNAGVLAASAARLDEPPERLLEAARFYAREVLFHPQADAYRVLGLTLNASPEALKAHHRLLQHWLHPDRLHSADDSIFATRVNHAWNQLRNQARREAYDMALCSGPASDLIDQRAAWGRWPAWVASAPPALTPVPLPKWRRRLPVYILLTACTVLAWLGVRDAATQPDLSAWETPDATAEGPRDPLVLRPAPESPAKRTTRLPRPERQPTSLSAPSMSGKPGVVPARPRPHVRGVEADTVTARMSAAQPLAPRSPDRGAVDVAPLVALRSPTQPQSPNLVAVRQAAIPARPAPTPPSRATGSQDSAAAFDRIQHAQRTGAMLFRYMMTKDTVPPPIWNSPAIQASAFKMRQDLHQGGQQRPGPSEWRIGDRIAAVSVPVTQTGRHAQGRLSADLVWREGQWLVTGLSLEQAR